MPHFDHNLYDEISEICDFMPENFRRPFCFRWGLRGDAPHTTKQTAARFQCNPHSIASRLERCLSNIARHAHQHELPVLRSLLGDPHRWTERAWKQAGRWGNQESRFAEAVMLLALAGIDVAEARGAVRQHMIELGIIRRNQWTPPLTATERAIAAHEPVSRICDHILWPRNVAQLDDLRNFENMRPLALFAPARSGVFRSEKHGRLIEYGSDLERILLRHLDADPRVHSLQEQGLRIPYVIDEQAHDYFPDAVVRLQDGRVFVMEIKPSEHLGEYDQWLKWASAARYCATHGYGLYIGSPNRSIIDHYRIAPNPEPQEFVAGLAKEGALVGEQYKALTQLVTVMQLGLIATTELLDWRPTRSRIRSAEGADQAEARRLWALIARHA